MLGEPFAYWTTSSTPKLFQLLQFCVHFRMRYCDSSSFIGFVQECFDYSRIFCCLYEFWDCFFISLGAKSKNKKKVNSLWLFCPECGRYHLGGRALFLVWLSWIYRLYLGNMGVLTLSVCNLWNMSCTSDVLYLSSIFYLACNSHSQYFLMNNWVN